MNWLVPTLIDGRRVTVRTVAADEWEAQAAAQQKADGRLALIGHAIRAGEQVCAWGCCTLRHGSEFWRDA